VPQQYTSRATLRPLRTSRRVRALRVVGAGVAAAAVTATLLPQDSGMYSGAVASPDAVTSSDAAGTPADDAVAAAMVRASGALAHAEHVAAEAPHPEAVAEIVETTFVVRELVRRAADADADAASSSPASLPATASDDVAADTDIGTDTGSADSATTDAATTADPADDPAAATTSDTAMDVSSAADAAVAAAADAAGLSGEGQQAGDRDAIAAALEQQAAVLTELLATAPSATVDVTPAPSAEEIAAEQAAHLAALAAEAAQYANGQIPDHLLSELPWAPGSVLRADAAHQLALLNEAFAAHFGRDLAITDSYRSYADQVAVKRSRGRWAAQPGTSNHGYGVAVDLGGGIASFGSAEYEWMRANAGEFGWENPAWAQQGGSKPEPWHWEFSG
jgi:LAS superfamily LD-carboxypeptidase LdcB